MYIKQITTIIIKIIYIYRYHTVFWKRSKEHLGIEELNKNMATIEKGEGRLNRLKTAISDVQKVVSNFIESTGGDPRQGLNLIYSNVDDSKYR